ncbi:MAG: peptidylprolyl isomerase [Candidatus Pacebacteria bacterium]|nr:peptidylprolyl isomerase [Candidatus Paceibacterota bacterium]
MMSPLQSLIRSLSPILALALCVPVAAQEKNTSAPERPEQTHAAGPCTTDGPDLDQLFDFLPDIVATYNETPITRAQVLEAISPKLLAHLAQGNKPNRESLREIALHATQQLINQTILFEASKQAGFTPDVDKAGTMVSNLEKKVGREKFAAGLEHQGVSRGQFCQNVAKKVAVQEWIQSIQSSVDTSDEALKKAYEENIDAMKTPERVDVSHILIEVPPEADNATVEAAREKAVDIQERLKKDAVFSELARVHSMCNSAREGGHIGKIAHGETVKPFEEAAFSLKEDEVSDLVRTKYGFHIIKVHEHIPSERVPFEEAKEELKAALPRQVLQRTLHDVINDARENADITIKIAEE